MNQPDTLHTINSFSLNPLVARLAAGIEDPRILLALGLCQDQIKEPPLGLSQIRKAIGILRPKGTPCERTIQRWVDEKGMPWAPDHTTNQRVYLFSECLAWYQRTFRYVAATDDAETKARDKILRDLHAGSVRKAGQGGRMPRRLAPSPN